MGSASGDALEWALALLQAPAERHALRQRPLPDGMLELLEITAGGASQTLMQAAARFAERRGGRTWAFAEIDEAVVRDVAPPAAHRH